MKKNELSLERQLVLMGSVEIDEEMEGKFKEYRKVMKEPRKKTETIEGKKLFEFGVISI